MRISTAQSAAPAFQSWEQIAPDFCIAFS